MKSTKLLRALVGSVAFALLASRAVLAGEPVHYRTAAVDDVKVFYREAGPNDAPNVLLHGEFKYDFDHLASVIDHFTEIKHLDRSDDRSGAAFFTIAGAKITSLWVLGDVDAVKRQLECGNETPLTP